MIVCHCNRISEDDLRCAVECAKNSCPGKRLCPALLYRRLNKKANCCGCFPLARKLIHQIVEDSNERREAAANLQQELL